MKNKKLLLVVPFLLFCLAGCGVTPSGESKSEPESQQPSETTVAVTGVTLDQTTLELGVGGSQKLNATVAPANASNTAVTWASDHEDIASVAPTGLVTANAPGEAVITVTTRDGGFTASCTVTVVAPKYGSEEYPLSVAEALAIAAEECDAADKYTGDYLYVEAYVLQSTGFGSYASNFKIGDSMTAAAADQLLVYSCNYNNDLGAFYKGDKVLIKGAITNYKGTIEMTNVKSGNTTVYGYPENVAIKSRGTSTLTFDTVEHVTFGSKPEAASAQNGTLASFTATPDSGYEIVNITNGGAVLTADAQGKYNVKYGNDSHVSGLAKPTGSTLEMVSFVKAEYTGTLVDISDCTYSSSYGNYTIPKKADDVTHGMKVTVPTGAHLLSVRVFLSQAHDNTKVYAGADTTGTLLHTGAGSNALSDVTTVDGKQAYYFTVAAENDSTTSMYIHNPSTYNINVYGLQIIYMPAAA